MYEEWESKGIICYNLSMTKLTVKLYILSASVMAVILSFFGLRYAAGFILGVLAEALNLFRNEMFWNDVLDTGVASAGTGSFHFLINYLVMILVMVISAKFPQYLNIFTCAAGLVWIKAVLLIETFWKGRTE